QRQMCIRDREGLFEPFRSHKAGGTGLGLSIARRLARRMGGEVRLEPREGGGARARLSLPRGTALARVA
ncbi:MAG: ATP-binding protein, partial [Candidatus Eisenbacteria bacterium]|nr:ATP-binding protein [Candidatus Eisenbacteria bacterium]